ncbi:chemotaxis protein [Anaerosporomusa subterranea]|uniref:Chemotaxis protein n=1 Tax=Anaerosporomusa subterranea TaxID=1794912 RepID=A0A154BQ49_ANASB|nr:methyl-accepting chemotaxis protein [Anaerosporomusa subterranea]KYZ76041.1 chemotaxis protein [Anaerosporomusa subterranea]
MRINIGTQILAVCIMIVIAFSGLSIYTYFQIDAVQVGYDGVIARSVPLVIEVKDLNIELNNQAALVRGFILSADERYVQDYNSSRQRMDKTVASLEQKLITPEGKQKVTALKNVLADYHQVSDQGILLRKTKGQTDALAAVAAAKAKVEAADKTMIDTVTFLTERMHLRTKENVTAGDKIQRILGILDVVIFLVGCALAIFLSRRISRPLNEVAKAAQTIADGDLRARAIAYNANDEISDMLKAFTQMTDNLRHLVGQVAKSVEQVSAASEELTASADQSAQASNQVAETISQIASGAASQLSGAEQSVSVVREMASAINHVAANANNVSMKSGETARAADAGNDAVRQATNQMQSISKCVAESAQVVQSLGASSQQIGEIVDVISGIAGQTNLLALNAAIEAARAGEQGRGFAVVADEVRKLAEQSHEAAQKITVIVRDIQNETCSAVTTMEQGTNEVARGTEVIASTGTQFSQIATMVQSLNNQIQEISAAAEELSASSDNVLHAADSSRTGSAEIAGNAQTISAAAEEQSASMQEIASSSQSLAHMATELNEIISKFRV